MNINSRNKAIGAILGVGMVVGTVMPAQAATTPTTQTTSVSASAAFAFTRDLKIGTQGADVTALQNYLMTTGHYTFAGGATGYFGTVTQGAVARWQAANGIAPAAGYFGAISRAKYLMLTAVVTPPINPGPGTSTPILSGGEADLRAFDLRRESTSGSEGEQDVEVFTAQFDVEDGDVRIERMEITASSTNNSLNMQPWKYFETVTVSLDGKQIKTMDVDSRSDWSQINKGSYRLTLTGLEGIVREDDRAELTVSFDISDSIDTNDLAQQFAFSIADRGIRASDSENIQHYVGNSSDIVTFGFDAQENGKVRLTSSDEDPDASILVADQDKESSEYVVFAFDAKNDQDVDALLTDARITVGDLGAGISAGDVIRRATLVVGSKKFDAKIGTSTLSFDKIDYTIDGDSEETFELRVRLVRNATSTPISFAVDAADLEIEGADTGDNASVSGSAQSATHTIALTGIGLAASSASAQTIIPGNNAVNAYGSYTIKFKVTGIDGDAYIASTTASTGTAGVIYSIGGNTFTGTETVLLSSTAQQQNGYFRVREGRTETFTLTVILDPSVAGTFDVRLGSITFGENPSMAGTTTFTVDANNVAFHTNPTYIPN